MSKFHGLFETTKSREVDLDPPYVQATPKKHRGRPPGKRTNPEFVQITAYIRRETHRQVKLTLLEKGRQEFSELVEELLMQWITLRT